MSDPAFAVGGSPAQLPLSNGEIANIRELLDKQAIYENMVKYTRALDRFDEVNGKAAYWPDATDDHGGFVGNAHEFIETTIRMRRNEAYKGVAHMIGNVQIELLGDQAKAESTFLTASTWNNPDGDGDRDFVNLGRYRDLYERRQGEWKILRRTCIWDWCRDEPAASNWQRWLSPDCENFGADFPNDPIYKEW